MSINENDMGFGITFESDDVYDSEAEMELTLVSYTIKLLITFSACLHPIKLV